MRYWDSSALVVLHVQQAASSAVRSLYARDAQVLTWILSDLEVRSAILRLGREGGMSQAAVREALSRADAFWESLHIVSAVDAVKARAKRLLGVHALKAADALQLGAALAAAYDDPTGWGFVCLDERLGAAARAEGFVLVP